MKNIRIIKYFKVLLFAGLLIMAGCNDPIYDFGYDGQLTGTIIDQNGNPVSGDIKVATFTVYALGELDRDPMFLRVQGDGTYRNVRLYPQKYDLTLHGPFVESPIGPVNVDLTGDLVKHDFQVTPLLTLSAPSISGSPRSTEVTVNYSITGNAGNVPGIREVYVSTVSWPTRTTGSGMLYRTYTAVVTENQGSVTISGLQPGTEYFVRVGARAANQGLFNHSEQIKITTTN